jgi:hypothetical protein
MEEWRRAPAPLLGIDFVRLAADSAAAGFAKDGPPWDEAMDDPKLSRLVSGLK